MSDQDPPRPPPSSGPPISQPYQYIDTSEGHQFTPYYKTPEEAAKSPGTWTPHLHNSLSEPPREWPAPRNQFPKSDPIMDAREGGSKPGGPSHEEATALKKIEELTLEERFARDKKEFPATPPDVLSEKKKQVWVTQYAKLFHEGDPEDMDPHKHRPRGELKGLMKLADLMTGGSKA
ncbi:hypothetical protein BDR22DRAFT_888645 [Usnea florida]